MADDRQRRKEKAEALQRTLDDAERLRKAREVEGDIRKTLFEHRQEVARFKEALTQAAIKWLAEKWGDRGCPYCGETQWEVGTPRDGQGEIHKPSDW